MKRIKMFSSKTETICYPDRSLVTISSCSRCTTSLDLSTIPFGCIVVLEDNSPESRVIDVKQTLLSQYNLNLVDDSFSVANMTEFKLDAKSFLILSSSDQELLNEIKNSNPKSSSDYLKNFYIQLKNEVPFQTNRF